jgi:hypothetical protein
MFEMKIKKMAHLTYLVIFHLKMIDYQKFNLQHTYGHDLEITPIFDMIIMKLFTWLPNLISITWNHNVGVPIFFSFLKSIFSLFAFFN